MKSDRELKRASAGKKGLPGRSQSQNDTLQAISLIHAQIQELQRQPELDETAKLSKAMKLFRQFYQDIPVSEVLSEQTSYCASGG